MNYHFELRSKTEFRDLDALGHVYHVNYMVFFENVRTEFWNQVTGKSGLEALDFVMARIECDFLAPVYLAEELVSRVRVARVGRKSVTLEYLIESLSRQRPVARGLTVQVAYDYESRAPKALEAPVKARLEELLAGANPA